VITAFTLALLILAYVIIGAVINATKDSGDGTGGTTSSPPPEYDAELGESYYGSSALALPMIGVESMVDIEVDCHEGLYGMSRPEGRDYFLFWYGNRDNPYIPDIAGSENSFDYTSLYAVDTSDSFKQTKLSKFCYGVGTLIFDYYVDLRSDDPQTSDVNERSAQLEIYGLLDGEGEGGPERITVTYKLTDGKEKSYTVIVGDKLVSGSGYYFMIEGRDRIYSSVSSSRFDYALGGFESFIHSRIIAKGLDKDKTFEPYLTTDFQQWKNTYVDTEGSIVPENSTVIIYTDTASPIYSEIKDGTTDPADPDGYLRDGKQRIEIPLRSLKDSAYLRMKNALVGKAIDADGENLTKVTVINSSNQATLYDSEKGEGEYTYEITAIESVISAETEIFTVGTPTLGYDLLKVTYNYSIDGKKIRDNAHAVIDLNDEVFESVKAELTAASVGTLSSPVTLTVRYGEDNAYKRELIYKVTEIVSIQKLTDAGGVEKQKVVAEDSVIYITYETVMKDSDGGSEVVERGEGYYDLSSMTDDAPLYSVKAALIGRAVGKCNVLVKVGEMYFQAFDDFVCYEIDRIEAFVTSEIVVAFSYVNETERDAFYGESTFRNDIAEHDTNNPYSIYALNEDNCTKIVRLLGGISENTTNAGSEGLVGDETVAVGLTPEVMERYYLYEGTTVYYELPRGIEAVSENSPDYKWASTLGFTLYISPVQTADGERFVYVGSDAYDVVVKMSAETFSFVDYSFPDFWARRNLAMVSSTELDRVDVEFNMSDMAGKYSFRLDHTFHYIRGDGTHALEKEDNTTEYDFISVYPTIEGYDPTKAEIEGVYNKTLFSYYQTQYAKQLGLHDIYNIVINGKVTQMALSGHDSQGTDCFKETLKMLYTTYYIGSLTAEEQAEALSGEAAMRIAFYVDESSTANRYVYEFYRLDDRRVMVSFFREARDGSSATPRANAMYISDFAFKKIVRAYNDMLNGKIVDADVGYDTNG